MNLAEAVLLGMLQGILEWLPVSSEGISSILLMNFFGKSLSEAVNFSIWLHTGTLGAAVVYFRKELLSILKTLPKYDPKRHELTTFLLVSTLFTGIVGGSIFLFGLNKLNLPFEVAMGLIGIFLLVSGVLQVMGRKVKGLKKKVGIGDSVILGVVQGFSVLPGLSRSGLTVSALLLKKYEAKEALRLSFLMSVPAVLIGEIGLGLVGNFSFDFYSLIAVGVSFLFGLCTISFLMKVAERLNFGIFCILLGILVILGSLIYVLA